MRPVLSSALKRLKGIDEAQALLLFLPTDARKASARVFAAKSPTCKPLELKTTSTAPQVRFAPEMFAPEMAMKPFAPCLGPRSA